MLAASKDADHVTCALGDAGLTACAVTGDELLAAIADNRLGGAILTLAALRDLDIAALRQALAAQPPWSDCPFILLVPRGDQTGAHAAFACPGNVVLLEQPLLPGALVAAARQAMRTRSQQIGTHTRMEERASELSGLRDRNDEYLLSFELCRQIPWSAGAENGLLSISEKWLRRLNVPIGNIADICWSDFVLPEDLQIVQLAWQQSRSSGTTFDVAFRMRSDGGPYRWHRARATPVLGPGGQIIKWIGVTEDIDDRRETEIRFQTLQTELAQMSRLSAMGAMASTLAHELNQPLTAATNFLRGVRRLLEQDPAGSRDDLIEAVTSADRNATRAGEIVRRLRDMVSRGAAARHPEKLGSVIRDACALSLIDAGSRGISHVIDIADEEAMIDIDRIQIQQVLHNLLRNSVEALGKSKGGEIIISAQQQGDYQEIIVADNGPGIAAPIAERMFGAFNSSKPDGMGIGLSISRTIIEAHGGRIHCDQIGRPGARFRFTVLRTRDQVSQRGQACA